MYSLRRRAAQQNLVLPDDLGARQLHQWFQRLPRNMHRGAAAMPTLAIIRAN